MHGEDHEFRQFSAEFADDAMCWIACEVKNKSSKNKLMSEVLFLFP